MPVDAGIIVVGVLVLSCTLFENNFSLCADTAVNGFLRNLTVMRNMAIMKHMERCFILVGKKIEEWIQKSNDGIFMTKKDSGGSYKVWICWVLIQMNLACSFLFLCKWGYYNADRAWIIMKFRRYGYYRVGQITVTKNTDGMPEHENAISMIVNPSMPNAYLALF